MSAFELFFSVSGGYPIVDASLTLHANGQAEMFLGNSWSMPGKELDRAGWFGGVLPEKLASEIDQRLTAPSAAAKLALLQQAQAEMLPFDTLVKTLRLEQAGKSFKLKLPVDGSDPWVTELEDLLRQAMTTLSSHPRQALQLQASLKRDDGTFLPTFHLNSIGTEPVTVLLHSTSSPPLLCSASVSFETRIEFPDGSIAWNPKLNHQVPPTHWLGMVEQGDVLDQVHLEPQEGSLDLLLPAVPGPAEEAGFFFTGIINLWLLGADGKQLQLTLKSNRQPLAQIG